MTPRYRYFLGTVVVPLTLGLWAAGYLVSGEAQRLQFDESHRVAATARTLLQREVTRAVSVPGASVRTLRSQEEGPDSLVLAEGDTLFSLEWIEGGFEGITWVRGPEGGTVERRAAVTPLFLSALRDVAGYRGALYLDGVRRAATEEDFGPERLSSRLHFRMAIFPEGLPFRAEDTEAIILPMSVRAGSPPSVALLAAPTESTRSILPPFFLLTVTLGGILLALAGRPFLHLRSGRSLGNSRWVGFGLVLLPLLVSWAVLLGLARSSQAEARQGTVQELARAMAFIRVDGEGLPLADLRAMTGFEVTRIRDGEVLESTIPASADRDRLLERIPPPGPFTVTGRHPGSDRETVFMAGRLGRTSTVVLSTPRPEPPDRSLELRLLVLGLGMGMLVLLFPVVVFRSRWLPGLSRRVAPGIPGVSG